MKIEVACLTRKGLLARVGAALILTASLVGCASFKAIKATGDLGAQLSGNAESLAYGGTICAALLATSANTPKGPAELALRKRELARQLSSGNSNTCEVFQHTADGWADVMESLALYGAALSTLAGSHEVDLSSQAEGLRVALNKAELSAAGSAPAKGVTRAASKLVSLIFSEVRRKALSKRIEEANPLIQQISEALIQHMAGELSLLHTLSATMNNLAEDYLALPEGDLIECSSEGSAEMVCDSDTIRQSLPLLLYAQEAWTLERKRALMRVQVEVNAFARAHSVLARNPHSLGKNDAEYLSQVNAEVRNAYESGLLAHQDDKKEE